MGLTDRQSQCDFDLKRLSLVEVTIRRGMDWMIGFIDTLYTLLGNIGNYLAIADLHTSQFTVTHTLRF
jgi:hypothetical protein